jgi:UDPglucose--hexose-1-phosphate uridylyltransferase
MDELSVSQGSYRYDPMTGAWVLVAPARGGVPRGPDPLAGLPEPAGACPFCPGNEADTEASVLAWPGEPDWRIRVVRNRHPAVREDASFEVQPRGGEALAPHGMHEVVIESTAHDLDLPDFTPGQMLEVLQAYRERVRALERSQGVRHVSIFRNRGRRAGSSQPHPHGQILASAVIGSEVQRRSTQARSWFERHGTTLLDDVLQRELEAGQRIVEARGDVVVLCPFAPHFAYQTWIVPRRSRSSFGEAPDAELARIAEALPDVIRRVLFASGRSDYTLLWRMPPAHASEAEGFWYLDLLPRGGGGAGFEMSTGIDLIPVTPEQAAGRI